MAKIEVKDKSIEVETAGFTTYVIEITFKTEDTEDGYTKSASIKLDDCNTRQKCTFSHVQTKIDEYFQEYFPELEITKLCSVKVIEKEYFKTGFDLD